MSTPETQIGTQQTELSQQSNADFITDAREQDAEWRRLFQDAHYTTGRTMLEDWEALDRTDQKLKANAPILSEALDRLAAADAEVARLLPLTQAGNAVWRAMQAYGLPWLSGSLGEQKWPDAVARLTQAAREAALADCPPAASAPDAEVARLRTAIDRAAVLLSDESQPDSLLALAILEAAIKGGDTSDTQDETPDLIASIKAWKLTTFGDTQPAGQVDKIAEEMRELFANPGDAMEQADVIITMIGVPPLERWIVALLESIPGLADAVRRKHEINKARRWRQDAGGKWAHVAGEEASNG